MENNTDTNTIVKKAKIYFASGQLEKSIEYFSLAESFGEHLIDIWMSRGAAHMALGNYQAASKDFALVLQQDPENERAYYFQGVALVALGEFEDAVESLTQSLMRNNNRGIAHLLRGVAYVELGNDSDAVLDINSASAFSSAEFESFAKVFGNMPDVFKHSKALFSRENAPWNNLLSRETQSSK